MRVELNDVIDAIEEMNEDDHPYYDPLTGEILWEGPSDDHDVIYLPDKADRQDYRTMERFIETIDDPNTAEWLQNSIVGKGAFRRFRGTCEKFHCLDDWYDFEARAHRGMAILWCEDNGIVWHDEGRTEEKDEDDISDFIHEDYNEPYQKEVKPIIENTPIHVIAITDKNVMNALYVADECLCAMYHGESDLEYAEQQIRAWLQDGIDVFGASDHGRFVGIAAGYHEGDDYTLKAVYVKEDQRRKGIGMMLVKKLEEDTNPISYRLEVDPKQTGAVAFFAKAGYAAVPYILMRKIKD